MTNRSGSAPSPTEPPAFLAVTTYQNVLYGVSKSGHLLPLYVYAPLAEAYQAKKPYRVAFAPTWPVYSRNFALTYIPVVYLDKDKIADELEAEMTSQERKGDAVRPWNQLVYNGWPLYYVPEDQGISTSGMQTTMFIPATVDIPPPQTYPVTFSEHFDGEEADGDPDVPGPYLGP